MDKQLSGPVDADESAEPRREWTCPEIVRVIAGGAESGGSTSTDGIDIFS